eukprot:Skav221380  [mRNA]  locus=scaffold2286:312674:313159:- [translate_table: standard]
MDCCKAAGEEKHEFVEGGGPIKVRVFFDVRMECRDFPGDFCVDLLVKNETQDKTFKSQVVKDAMGIYYNRVDVNDYKPEDQLSLYLYNQDQGGIEEGHVEKIDIPDFKEVLTPELMNADAGKHDVMIVCHPKIRFSAYEWMRDLSSKHAQLIDKGAEMFLP